MLSKRNKPINLEPSDVKFFEHELVKEIPDHKIQAYDGKTIVTPDGVVIWRGGLEIESLYSDQHIFFLNGIYKTYYRYVSLFKENVKGPFLHAFDPWVMGYFHWVTEFIPRLFKAKHLLTESTVILPSVNNGIWNSASAIRSLYKKGSQIPQNGYFTESLEAFQLKSTYRHEARNPLIARNLYFSSHVAPSGNYNDLVMKELRGFYFKYYDIKNEVSNRLVYVSRNMASRRYIQNEQEVIESLRTLGFEIFELETLTFREQVILFSQTKFFISQHGAALTNLLFMKEDTFVLELKIEGDFQNLCYFSLASAMNVNYLYQFCMGDGRGVQDADIVVDIGKLTENITLAL